MQSTLAVISRDSSGIATVAQAKNWLRVTGDAEEVLIQGIINGAVAYAENYLNRTIGQNSYMMSLNHFSELVELRLPPVSAVTKIEYFDTDGAVQQFDVLKTRVNKEEGYLSLKQGEQWPDNVADEYFPIQIYYDSDGMIADNQGADILDAIKLIIGYRYDLRDDPNQRWRKASDSILTQLRMYNY
jgi:hypothetical protein